MNLLNFSSIFSGPENVFWFGLGVLSAQVWQWVKAKWKDFKYPKSAPHPFKKVNWLYVAIAMTFMIATFIGVQNQVTYDHSKNLARQVRDCQIEFNSALKARSMITDQELMITAQWQKSTLKVISALSNLPLSVAQAGPASQAMMDYEDKIIDRYLVEISEIEMQRRVNEEIRNQIPLPEPTCGVK